MAAEMHPVLSRFFATGDKTESEVLQRQLSFRTLAAGEKLYDVGAEADIIYIVLEGRFAVHRQTAQGGRTQVVALLEAGTVIGESALTADHRRGAAVVAVEPAAVAGLSRAGLAVIEESEPRLFIGFMKKVLSIISLRLQKSSERLAIVL